MPARQWMCSTCLVLALLAPGISPAPARPISLPTADLVAPSPPPDPPAAYVEPETTGPSPVPDWAAYGGQAGAGFGIANSAGDVNGDGYSDIIVGAYAYDHGEVNEGAAFLFYGSPNGLQNTPGWMSESNQSGAQFGIAVSTAGDVNGDGYDDVVIGARSFTNSIDRQGKAYLFYGSPSGLGAAPGWTALGETWAAYFGNVVGSAGDVNGDGYSDIIVGSHGFDGGLGWAQGRAYVWCGSPSGPHAAPCWVATGEQGSGYFAYTGTGSAGDVNGDGYSDVIVSAAAYSADQAGEGRAYLYYGSASGLMPAPGWSVEGNQAGAHLGYGWPAAGDVNGDGYADVILGAPLFDAGEHDEGAALLYHGGPAGPSAIADWRAESNQADANLGVSVGPAGDLNRDGYADVVVGAYRYDGGETDEGAAFVYYGSAAGLKASPDLTIEANQADANLGGSAGTAGDVNGDGYSDLIVNAGGYDSSQTDEGGTFVYHGRPAFPQWFWHHEAEDAPRTGSMQRGTDTGGASACYYVYDTVP